MCICESWRWWCVQWARYGYMFLDQHGDIIWTQTFSNGGKQLKLTDHMNPDRSKFFRESSMVTIHLSRCVWEWVCVSVLMHARMPLLLLSVMPGLLMWIKITNVHVHMHAWSKHALTLPISKVSLTSSAFHDGTTVSWGADLTSSHTDGQACTGAFVRVCVLTQLDACVHACVERWKCV